MLRMSAVVPLPSKRHGELPSSASDRRDETRAREASIIWQHTRHLRDAVTKAGRALPQKSQRKASGFGLGSSAGLNIASSQGAGRKIDCGGTCFKQKKPLNILCEREALLYCGALRKFRKGTSVSILGHR